MTGTQDQGNQQSETDPVGEFSDPTLKHQSARGNADKTYSEHWGNSGSHQVITMNLTSRSAQALEVATDLTGDSKTDTVNRALQVYAFLTHVISNGGSIYVRESNDADLEQLRFQ